jgi:hypothetical protein
MLLSGVAHATALAGEPQLVLRDRYVRIVLDGLRPRAASCLPGEPAPASGGLLGQRGLR